VQTWGDFSLESCYDSLEKEIVFKAVVPDQSWFSIGFGSSMTDCDMIAWRVTRGKGKVEDYWCSGSHHPVPSLDKQQDTRLDGDPFFDRATKRMTFVTRRKLDTGDLSQDFVVPLDKAIPMIYAYKKAP